MKRYSERLNRRVASQYCHVMPLHRTRLTPWESMYQLRHPPVFHTVLARSSCRSALNSSCALRVGATAWAPALSTAAIACAT